MKLPYFLLPAAALLLAGCTNDLDDALLPDGTTVCPDPSVKTDGTADYNPELFPQPDGSPRASTSSEALALCQIINKIDVKQAMTLGSLSIADEQYAEIKDYVDKNLKGATQTETYHNIFAWITKNVSYAWSGDAYLDPYDVFIHKRCVCQGYANLLRTMCHTQQIPAFNANGWLGTLGGHAWDYVCPDGEWIVSDPTNNQEFKMANYSSYAQKLIVKGADLTLFENDEILTTFKEGHYNLQQVKRSPNCYFVVPFSLGGFRITSFNLGRALPDNVTQVYLGKNIETLGEYPEDMARYMPNVQEIFVDPSNRKITSYGGALYKGTGTTPILVPPACRRIQLKKMKVMEKNTLINLDQLEEIVLAEGTQSIEAYAVESCPKLRRVYVPSTVTSIDEKAFYRCPADVEIIRMPTGIHEVTR